MLVDAISKKEKIALLNISASHDVKSLCAAVGRLAQRCVPNGKRVTQVIAATLEFQRGEVAARPFEILAGLFRGVTISPYESA